MESIGMTKKQKRKMFFWEGNWYFLLVEVLVLTVGTGILWLVRLYMEKQAAYFRFQYPAGWLAGISLGMLGILLVAVVLSDGEKRFSVRNDMDR